MEDVTALVEGLGSLISRPEFAKNNESRQEAVRLSREITTALQQPESVAVELAFSTFVPMSARIAVDLGLFKHLVDAHRPLTAGDLASLSGAEELFIKRILRPLAASHFVKEVAEDTWEATPVSEAMTQDGIAAGHRMLWEMLIGAAAKAPKYFKESGHRCPTNPQDGLMQYAFQTKLQTFDFFSTMPHIIRDFNTFMGNTMGARDYWVQWYPVSEQILDGVTKEHPLIVDVGGGKGHDLQAFHEKFPGQGRICHMYLKRLKS
ncbi:Sterigmatocystin 8-O-methyltransferase protein [Rutstroemia sp. NJR-2017a BBW]|nr:Sterigmatocystin 8-O-methyltransferase protein [Rutstroemia sp. NJR-2017a BBW]